MPTAYGVGLRHKAEQRWLMLTVLFCLRSLVRLNVRANWTFTCQILTRKLASATSSALVQPLVVFTCTMDTGLRIICLTLNSLFYSVDIIYNIVTVDTLTVNPQLKTEEDVFTEISEGFCISISLTSWIQHSV